MKKKERDRLRGLERKASEEVHALCNGKKWRMCIPAHPDDTDLVISEALNALIPLLDYADQKDAECKAANHSMVEAVLQRDQALARAEKSEADKKQEYEACCETVAVQLGTAGVDVSGCYDITDLAIRIPEIAEERDQARTALAQAERQIEALRDSLLGFVEYFQAIKDKKVGPPREQIRTFEMILLDAGRAALATRKAREKGAGSEGA